MANELQQANPNALQGLVSESNALVRGAENLGTSIESQGAGAISALGSFGAGTAIAIGMRPGSPSAAGESPQTQVAVNQMPVRSPVVVSPPVGSPIPQKIGPPQVVGAYDLPVQEQHPLASGVQNAAAQMERGLVTAGGLAAASFDPNIGVYQTGASILQHALGVNEVPLIGPINEPTPQELSSQALNSATEGARVFEFIPQNLPGAGFANPLVGATAEEIKNLGTSVYGSIPYIGTPLYNAAVTYGGGTPVQNIQPGILDVPIKYLAGKLVVGPALSALTGLGEVGATAAARGAENLGVPAATRIAGTIASIAQNPLVGYGLGTAATVGIPVLSAEAAKAQALSAGADETSANTAEFNTLLSSGVGGLATTAGAMSAPVGTQYRFGQYQSLVPIPGTGEGEINPEIGGIKDFVPQYDLKTLYGGLYSYVPNPAGTGGTVEPLVGYGEQGGLIRGFPQNFVSYSPDIANVALNPPGVSSLGLEGARLPETPLETFFQTQPTILQAQGATPEQVTGLGALARTTQALQGVSSGQAPIPIETRSAGALAPVMQSEVGGYLDSGNVIQATDRALSQELLGLPAVQQTGSSSIAAQVLPEYQNVPTRPGDIDIAYNSLAYNVAQGIRAALVSSPLTSGLAEQLGIQAATATPLTEQILTQASEAAPYFMPSEAEVQGDVGPSTSVRLFSTEANPNLVRAALETGQQLNALDVQTTPQAPPQAYGTNILQPSIEGTSGVPASSLSQEISSHAATIGQIAASGEGITVGPPISINDILSGQGVPSLYAEAGEDRTKDILRFLGTGMSEVQAAGTGPGTLSPDLAPGVRNDLESIAQMYRSEGFNVPPLDQLSQQLAEVLAQGGGTPAASAAPSAAPSLASLAAFGVPVSVPVSTPLSEPTLASVAQFGAPVGSTTASLMGTTDIPGSNIPASSFAPSSSVPSAAPSSSSSATPSSSSSSSSSSSTSPSSSSSSSSSSSGAGSGSSITNISGSPAALPFLPIGGAPAAAILVPVAARGRKYRYQPSLLAQFEDITATQIPANYLSGYGIRPIIIPAGVTIPGATPTRPQNSRRGVRNTSPRFESPDFGNPNFRISMPRMRFSSPKIPGVRNPSRRKS